MPLGNIAVVDIGAVGKGGRRDNRLPVTGNSSPASSGSSGPFASTHIATTPTS